MNKQLGPGSLFRPFLSIYFDAVSGIKVSSLHLQSGPRLAAGHRSWFPITQAPGTDFGGLQSWASRHYILGPGKFVCRMNFLTLLCLASKSKSIPNVK